MKDCRDNEIEREDSVAWAARFASGEIRIRTGVVTDVHEGGVQVIPDDRDIEWPPLRLSAPHRVIKLGS